MLSGSMLSNELVRSLSAALEIRRLRNTCYQFLTQHRARIGVLEQLRWYLGFYRTASKNGAYRLYLFRLLDGTPVGYGALKLEHGRLLVTECVGEGYRKQGIGRSILGEMVSIAKREGRELVAEIRADNRASVTLHEQAGLELFETATKDSFELRRYRLGP